MIRLTAECTDGVLLTVCEIAGTMFLPKEFKEQLKLLPLGRRLELLRDINNEHDPFAVEIHLVDDDPNYPRKLGYIPGKSSAYENKLLSHLMDKGCSLYAIVRSKGDPEGLVKQYVTLGVYLRT